MNLLSIYKKENYTLARKYEFYVLVTRTIPGLTREILSLPLKKLIFCRRRIKSSFFGFLMEVFWESSFSSDTWLQGWLELISVAQSAYRENHSTETVLPKVKNDIFVLLLIVSTTGSYWRHSGYNLGEGCLSVCDRIYQGVISGYEFVGVSLGSLNWNAESLKAPVLSRFICSISLLDVVQDYIPSVHCYTDDTHLEFPSVPHMTRVTLLPFLHVIERRLY